MNDSVTKEFLDIEKSFEFYIKKVGFQNLDKSSTQYIELKRAFYGAFGICLLVTRDVIGEMSEEKAIGSMQDMLNQAEMFWEDQIRQR